MYLNSIPVRLLLKYLPECAVKRMNYYTRPIWAFLKKHSHRKPVYHYVFDSAFDQHLRHRYRVVNIYQRRRPPKGDLRFAGKRFLCNCVAADKVPASYSSFDLVGSGRPLILCFMRSDCQLFRCSGTLVAAPWDTKPPGRKSRCAGDHFGAAQNRWRSRLFAQWIPVMIASLLGIPANTVATRICRAKRRLKELLEP